MSPKARITSGYGKRHEIVGRLTGPGGVPISGALIEVRETPEYAGAKAVALASPRTGPDGRFSLKVAGGVSCRLRIAYRAHLGDALPVATRTLGLAVRAGVRLHVAPHVTSVGGRIFFTGRLLGGPLLRGGKELVLEARSPGGPWLQFDVLRTRAKGRFKASYRFKFAGPVDYRFRVVSELEADFPFARGVSNTVGVHEL